MIKQSNTRLNSTSFYWTSIILAFSLSMNACRPEMASTQVELVYDFDQDGLSDATDLDDDNDGIPDDIETSTDLDGDQVPNFQDRDSDNDGIPDLIEATGVDKDGDGILDPWDEWTDENRNGFHDEYENEPLVSLQTVNGNRVWESKNDFPRLKIDQDGDQIPNFWDLDSDNDGKSDRQESSAKLSDFVDTNADGFDDRLAGHIYTQGDKEGRSGHPESKGEGIAVYETIYSDGSFGLQNGNPDIDDNNNGLPDFLDPINEN